MKERRIFKVGEIYHLKEDERYVIIIDNDTKTIPAFNGTWKKAVSVVRSHRKSEEGIMMVTFGSKILLAVSINDETVLFTDHSSSIVKYTETDADRRFSDEPVYVMTADELEAMQCKMFGPKCPLSGGRCHVCKGQEKLPNADRYMIVDRHEQGSD